VRRALPNRATLCGLPAALAVGTLAIAAVAGLVSRSLRPGALIGGELGLSAWSEVLSDPAFRSAVQFTLVVAVISTAIALLIAVPLGLLARQAGPWVRSLLTVLLPVPHLVVAAATVSWFGPGRLLDRAVFEIPIIGDRFGLGIIVVYVVKEIPFLVLLVVATLDPATDRLDDAARSLGASRWHRWRFILGPRLGWPVGLGSLVVAAFVIGSTEVPLVVGPNRPEVITTYALSIVRINGPIARANAAVALTVAIMVIVGVALGIVALARLSRRARVGLAKSASGGLES